MSDVAEQPPRTLVQRCNCCSRWGVESWTVVQSRDDGLWEVLHAGDEDGARDAYQALAGAVSNTAHVYLVRPTGKWELGLMHLAACDGEGPHRFEWGAA